MLDKHTGLTADILRMLLIYDPATGFFYWRESAGTGRGGWKRIAGKRAGWKDKSRGYRNIQLPGYKRGFLEHRLAWLYMTGEWPEDQVDHKDQIFDHNWWDNLRPSTNGRNQANRGLRPHNKSGVTGVWFQKGRWWAECVSDGVRVLSKSFKTKEEAIEARRLAVKQYHGEYGVKQ